MRRMLRMTMLIVLLSAVLVGCGRSASRFLPISGKVTFKGEVLEIGSIQFFTDKGPAGGAMIQRGEYRLPADSGLEPGTYRVSISATEPIPEAKTPEMSAPPTRELIPAEFNSAGKRTIEVTAAGNNEFNFDIP